MNTGDSCFITPFVPHSFTGRGEDDPALIIAVTFAGEVRRAMSEIVRAGPAVMDELAGDLRNNGGYGARLKNALDAESMVAEDLAGHLMGQGLEEGRARELAGGKAEPGSTELEMIAGFLNLLPALLMVPPLPAGQEVITRWAAETPVRTFPKESGYGMKELLRTDLLPYLKGFEIQVPRGPGADLRHGLHEYVYVHGETPVVVSWGGKGRHREVLQPGDSAYFQPMTPHAFEGYGGEGRLVSVRIPGRLNSAVLNEYASFPKSSRGRAAQETKRWF
jgi:methylphosphonate synthase